MSTLKNIKSIILDINGTVYPIDSCLRDLFIELGLDTDLIQLFFTQILLNGISGQISGVFAPFSDYAGHQLQQLLLKHNIQSSSSPQDLSKRIAECMTNNAHPYLDVAPALTSLQQQGIKIAALTNGSVHIARNVLENKAGVRDVSYFDINEPMAWKPSREAYMFAVNALMYHPSEVMMVASHPWDCHGALQCGLRACYVQRDDCEEYSFVDKPELIVRSFDELAEKFRI